MTAPRLQPGQLVAGKFTVRALLGYGGATATYAAQLPPNRDVVVKVFSPQLAQRSDVLGVLQQAASVTNVMPDSTLAVAESGFDQATGAPYVVTDASPFPSLAATVERGPLAPADVVAILRGIARAVDAAHAQRLAHGALKPQNVFVGPLPDRAVRVGDFGVAVARAALPTNEGFAAAAPWIAPEQMQGAPGAPASDTFSAALVAFHALTGKSYWRSCQGPQPDLAAWQQESAAPRVPPSQRARELGANVPVVFDGALLRALSLNPAERFTTLAELADTLSKASGGPQKMAMTMPLTAMPQAAQDMLRKVGQQPAQQQPPPAQQGFSGTSTLAINSPLDMAWPPGAPSPAAGARPAQGAPQQAAMQPPPGMGPQQPPQQGMQGAPPGMQGPPPGMQGPPRGAYGPPPQGQGMLPTPYGGFQAPAQAPMGGGMLPPQGPVQSYAPPPESSIVVPKSRGGLVIVLAIIGVLVVVGVVVLVVVLRQRAVVAALPTESTSEPTATTATAANTAPPSSAAPTPTPPASTAAGSPTPSASADNGAAVAPGDAGAAAAALEAGAAQEGELTILCVPDCDSVKVDDTALDTNDAGVVPSTPMPLATGPHTIAVAKATYMNQTRRLTLKAGQKDKETFYMTKPGAIAPASKPCGKFLERCPQ